MLAQESDSLSASVEYLYLDTDSCECGNFVDLALRKPAAFFLAHGGPLHLDQEQMSMAAKQAIRAAAPADILYFADHPSIVLCPGDNLQFLILLELGRLEYEIVRYPHATVAHIDRTIARLAFVIRMRLSGANFGP